MTPILVLILTLAASQPAAVPSTGGIVVNTRVDPPAMWVADRVTYTVDVSCPPGVDIVVEDLDRSRLSLNGLDLVFADTQRRQEGAAVRYVFQYVVTTYRVDVAAPGIGALKVRYFLSRPGQRAQDAAPAGSITVPPVTIPFRSLLPDDPTGSEMREGGAIPPRWVPYRLLGIAGLGLVLISIVPALVLLVRVANGIRRRRRAERRPSTRRARQIARETLATIAAGDASNPQARREGFTRLEALVRGHLSDTVGPEYAALTADEIRSMPANGYPNVAWERVTALLASCEIARFAGLHAGPSPEDWRRALDDAAVIVGTVPDGR
jgi:hypothetical protein